MTEKKSMEFLMRPTIEELGSSILLPPITVDSFEINPVLLQWMTDNCQFEGCEEDNPYEHLTDFLQICATFKIHRVSDDAIRLRLFPFSLKTKAKEWLRSLPRDSITTWDELVQKFLTRYFPCSKTVNYISEIRRFQQAEGESLYDAWERYKSLLRKCPHHKITKSSQVEIFYGGLSSPTKLFVYASTQGSIVSSPAEAYDLIDSMAMNDSQRYLSDERFNKRQTDDGALSSSTLETLRQQINENKMTEVYDDPRLVDNRHTTHPNHYTPPQQTRYAYPPQAEPSWSDYYASP